MKKISIIVPVRNEAAAIEDCILSLLKYFPQAEIIVVDGGWDETESIVLELTKNYQNVIYIKNHNDRGKGHAIKVGIKKSTGDLIAQFDSDLQFAAEDLIKLFAPLENDVADMTLGSRFTAGAVRVDGSTPFLRTLGNSVISLFASTITLHQITDILAGIKAWKKEVTASYNLSSDNYSYEAELPIMALKKNWRANDVPGKTFPRNTGFS